MPKGVKVVTDERDWIVLDAGEAWVLVRPIGEKCFWLGADGGPRSVVAEPRKDVTEHVPPARGTIAAALVDYDILVVPGKESGYVIEAVLKKDVPAPKRTKLQVATAGEFRVEYTSVAGDTIVAKHEPVGLRASATINGTPVDWSRWADGGVYASPYITVRDGVMRVSDGRETYVVDFTGPRPVWRTAQ